MKKEDKEAHMKQIEKMYILYEKRKWCMIGFQEGLCGEHLEKKQVLVR